MSDQAPKWRTMGGQTRTLGSLRRTADRLQQIRDHLAEVLAAKQREAQDVRARLEQQRKGGGR